MAILVTNDDGIFTEGLRVLVKELTSTTSVVVVAPDRERSAIGTAVTLYQPLKIHQLRPVVPEVDTYSVEGTPSDCVILALSKLVKNKVDMVVSGINRGTNLGDDVLISGTVAAALQGYLRGLDALAISTEAVDNPYLGTAAKLAALLAKRISSGAFPTRVFLNVNLPGLPLVEINGLKITHLASGTHTDVAEEGNDGRGKHYWIVRQKTDNAASHETDVWAVEQGKISLTPLHTELLNRAVPAISDNLGIDLLQELRKQHMEPIL